MLRRARRNGPLDPSRIVFASNKRCWLRCPEGLDVAVSAAHECALQVTKDVFAHLRDLVEQGTTDDQLAKTRDRHLWLVEAETSTRDGTLTEARPWW